MSRVIKRWASIYDLVSFFIYFIFKGAKRLHRDIILMSRIIDGKKVIDIGCGTGEFLLEIARIYHNISGYGIDASEEMVAIAKRKAQGKGHRALTFELAVAEKLPYQAEAFDCAFNIFLLHHLPMESKLKCLHEIHRVLRPQSHFLLVDVDKPSNLCGHIIGMTRYHIREIRENMQQPLTELLEKSGFSSIQVMRKDYGIFSFISCRKQE